MRLPNGYGGVTKLSGRRRKPYLVRKTAGWHYDEEKDKQVQDYIVIGYAPQGRKRCRCLQNTIKIRLILPHQRLPLKKSLKSGQQANFLQYQNPTSKAIRHRTNCANHWRTRRSKI